MSVITRCLATGVLAGTLLSQARPAEACGCLAMPSPISTVLQAGERILFAKDGNDVVAYIQIKYSGAADHFGWLVPLPSVPTLELGTDEVFTALGAQTQPSYTITTVSNFCDGDSARSSGSALGGCGGFSEAPARSPQDAGFASAADAGAQNMGEVVIKASIGPFDYAVLKADDQTAMLSWLNTNRYFVPAGTMDAMSPYIHPGAYFLALKLKAGQSDGDIVPIVVRYASDLPMIPIILTSVGAVPNMGIQVWELGEARAIPRNYHHTVLDDMNVWLGIESYDQLAVRAIREAPQRHSFITEYAGTSGVMVGVLDPPGRFGNPGDLAAQSDASLYLSYLKDHGFLFDSTLISILSRYIPEPEELVLQGVTAAQYYASYEQFFGFGFQDGGMPPPLDANALTNEIEMRIVMPTMKTAHLFRQHPYLTRLFTALSPEDMNADPVFSENPDLPTVPRAHNATVTQPCRGTPWLVSEDTGLSVQFPSGAPPQPSLPGSLRIETLRESGPALVDTDNRTTIIALLGPVTKSDAGSSNGTQASSSCSVGELARFDWGALLLIGLSITIAGWPRRKRA